MSTKKLIKNPRVELGKLVQAMANVVRPVYIVPESETLGLIKPTGKISNKPRPCCRQVNKKYQQPQPCKELARTNGSLENVYGSELRNEFLF